LVGQKKRREYWYIESFWCLSAEAGGIKHKRMIVEDNVIYDLADGQLQSIIEVGNREDGKRYNR